jgi:cytochrome c oxidase subunit IV
MSKENGQHIVKYRTYAIILVILLVLTGLSVLVTSVELGPLSVGAALLFASIKATLVLIYFMHLKFDLRIYWILMSIVIFIIFSVIIGTLFDYIFR